MRNVRKILLLLTMFSILLRSAGCATFRGMGEDIENLGKAMKRAIS